MDGIKSGQVHHESNGKNKLDIQCREPFPEEEARDDDGDRKLPQKC